MENRLLEDQPRSSINTHREVIKEHFKAAISVDCVIFGYDSPNLKILTMTSLLDSFDGQPSLIGDLVDRDETLEDAAERILELRTGLRGVHMEQIKSFGAPDRHPLGRVITVAFYALVSVHEVQIDTSKKEHPQWVNIQSLSNMAFDHLAILKESLKILRRRFFTDTLYANLLPEKFTLSELQLLSEEVLRRKFDKRNFRKKILNADELIETDEFQKNVNHRPARLYRLRGIE